MPYDTEHACRLSEPVKGAPTKRVNGDRSHNGKKYDVIYQKKGKSWSEQAFRYPVKSWTPAAAKNHCTSHKGIRFEPAKQKAKAKKMKEQKDSAPQLACIFNEECNVTFADEDKTSKFIITAYSGDVIKNHWYWGNIAFDLDGTKFAKSPTPVLEEHFTTNRLGFTTAQNIDDKVTVEGRFLDNDRGRQMAADIKSGFPMEASLYIKPSAVERVSEGESAKVNGRTLKGPGTIFRKALIKEVSMVVFGADSNTRSLAANAENGNEIKYVLQKGDIMAKEKETESLSIEDLTLDQFQENCGDLYAQIVQIGEDNGVTIERDRFAELREACGEDYELLAKCFAEGKTVNETLKLCNAKLQTALKKKTEVATEAAKSPDDLARQEFSDTEEQQQSAAQSQEFDEKSATDEQLKKRFAEVQELQDKFTGADAYVSYVRHS